MQGCVYELRQSAPGHSTLRLTLSVRAAAPIGHSCSVGSTCRSGYCKDGQCAGKPCSDNNECSDGSCADGACVASRRAGAECAFDEECDSKLCYALYERCQCDTCEYSSTCLGGCNAGSVCLYQPYGPDYCGSKLPNGSKCYGHHANCESGFCHYQEGSEYDLPNSCEGAHLLCLRVHKAALGNLGHIDVHAAQLPPAERRPERHLRRGNIWWTPRRPKKA